MDAKDPEKVDELDAYIIVERVEIGKASPHRPMVAD